MAPKNQTDNLRKYVRNLDDDNTYMCGVWCVFVPVHFVQLHNKKNKNINNNNCAFA